MNVISNTSPLIAFAKLQRFDILSRLFTAIIIPEAVRFEFLKNSTSVEEKQFLHECEQFVQIQHIRDKYISFSRKLGKGEQEALTLAICLPADLLLIDDSKGQNEAREHGLVIASTRAILKLAEEDGLLQSYQAAEEALRTQSFFVPSY